MTAPATEKNPAAVETAGLEIAVQRQREGSADPSKREPTTAAGAVEKAAPIPADVWTAAKKALRLADKRDSHEDFARRVTYIARAIMQDRADRASQEGNPRPAKTGGLETAVLRQPQEERIREKADDTRLSLGVEWEERIREDERDRLYAEAEMQHSAALLRQDAIAGDLHAGAALWLRECGKGAMLPADRARLRGDAS